MKKFVVLVVSLILSAGVAFAHGPGSREFGQFDRNAWQQMDKWHDVMHGISVKSEDIKNGVKLEITADSTEVLDMLKKDLQVNQEKLSAYFRNSKVSVNEAGKDITVQVTSRDKTAVKDLQYWRSNLVYQYLRDQMHGQFDNRMGFYGHMGGRGGWGHGYGPGMMGGCSGRGGYGPDAMQGGYHRDDYRQGMMDPDDDRVSGYHGGHMM